MLRQVKLLSLITLAVANSSLQGGIQAPFNYVESVFRRPGDLATLACAIVMGNIAYGLEQREYTGAGDQYRTVGTPEVDPLISTASYCLAAGTGLTAIENLVGGTDDLSAKERLINSAINSACLFGTDLVAKQDIYQSLDRNHPLFRGWLPFNVKFDDAVKRIVVFGGLRTALNALKARATTVLNTPTLVLK